jgi:hypothetical protein
MSPLRLASSSVLALLLAYGCGGNASSTGTGGSSSTGTGASSSTGTGGAGGSNPIAGCTVAQKGTAGVVIQGTLLLPSAPLAGELFVDGTGKIACAAASCASTAGYASATVLACPDDVISPGLINAHDHTEYATLGPVPHGTTRWDHRNGWRTGTGGEPLLMEPSSTTSVPIIAAQELRFVLGGATSVIGSGSAPGLLRNLASYPSLTPLEGLTGPSVYFDTFPLGDENGVELTSGCAYPSPEAASAAFEGGGAYAPHVSEGINLAAENEFLCASGSLGLVTAQTAIIHGVGLNANDVETIAKAGAKVIWAPRSNVSLYGNTAPVTEMKTLGVTIALGTDWLASGSMNMLRELACASLLDESYFAGAFTDQDLWLMATKNAAIAAKFDTQIGALTVGLWADVAVFSGTSKDYGAVIRAGVEDVRLVLRGGTVLYGDADIVTALSPSCAALDVCGIQKQVCVDTPGVTLADIQTAATPIYPLFFCKGTTPTEEPSCVPYRDTYTAGITATDKDGDGVPDTMDDCPDVFNPVRPMDGTTQADVNKNGIGDACDPKPL